MQAPFKIEENKHLGILFQPRSGSHVLRAFLAEQTSRANIGEFLNTRTVQIEFDIRDDGYTIIDKSNRGNQAPDMSANERRMVLENNMLTLQKMSDIRLPSVFGMPIGSYQKFYPEFLRILASRQDIQLISLLRADVLYSLISIFICFKTQIWHNQSSKLFDRKSDSYHLPIGWVTYELDNYILALQDIKENLDNTDVLYYEEFQFNVNILRNRFDGIPTRIASMPWSKFRGNHKDLITNLPEVEDFYEQFVNEHKEYFPQYFSKLPGVIIPACQGRQPRDLSLDLLAV